jgi:cell division inhibitor SulA
MEPSTAAVLGWAGDEEWSAPPASPTKARPEAGQLPPDMASVLWRGTELGSPVFETSQSGFTVLDAELPGGGWPCRALTEVLQVQASVAEWRLLAPAMRQVVAAGGNVVVVGPPRTPHLPGLRNVGLDERHLVWIQAEAPAQQLWVTEQLTKTNAAGLLVSWLPQARQEQIRRLHASAAERRLAGDHPRRPRSRGRQDHADLRQGQPGDEATSPGEGGQRLTDASDALVAAEQDLAGLAALSIASISAAAVHRGGCSRRARTVDVLRKFMLSRRFSIDTGLALHSLAAHNN